MKLFFQSRSYKKSFSQQGEDLVVDFILGTLNIQTPYYVDLGANHHAKYSNTYLFYRKGGHGICVEPNEAFNLGYRTKRSRDVLLNVGVTAGPSTQQPYHTFDWHEFNTFDANRADAVLREYAGRITMRQPVILPVLNVNELMTKYVARPIDFMSLDIEGLDLEILEALDYTRFAPKIICVESIGFNTKKVDARVKDALERKGYELRAGNQINSIYVRG